MKNPGGHPPTILIVEDIDWIRSGIKRSVQRCGYRALEAVDEAEAIRAAELEAPALILTEEAVPSFDALTARLREHPSLHKIPVVIINPDAEEGARHGDAFVLTHYEGIESLLASLRQ